MACRGFHAPSVRYIRKHLLCRQCHHSIRRYWHQNSSRRKLSSAARQAHAKHVLHCISGASTCHDGEQSSGNVKESSEGEELCLLRRAWLIAGAGTSLGLGTGEMTVHMVFFSSDTHAQSSSADTSGCSVKEVYSLQGACLLRMRTRRLQQASLTAAPAYGLLM